MKILHVVQAYYPFQEKGGPAFKVRSLAEMLGQRHHEVTVLTADLGLTRHPELARRLEDFPGGSRLELHGVEVIYLSTVAKYRALTVNPGLLAFCQKRLDAFDVVHFFGLYDLLGPTVSGFARRKAVPYVVEPMGMYRPIDRNLLLKRVWHRTLGRTFLMRAANIVATSKIEQKEILDGGFPAQKVPIRYNGIDSNLSSNLPPRGSFRSQWNLPRYEPLILFLSRLIPRKGAELLIEAFAAACPVSGRLVIAGPEGERGYRARLEAFASRTALRERIVFTGPVYGEEKKALYRDADVFVLASRYENFANVAAEAMVCGVPVIVSDSCGISELVEKERAGLVTSPEKRALSHAIRTVLEDHVLYKSLKEGCARVAVRLNWEALTAQMENHYQAAITAIT